MAWCDRPSRSTSRRLATNMQAEILRKQLELEHALVCFEDIADLNITHSRIFKLLHQYHKPCYENNERLVFYCGQRPSKKFLEHLQRAAAAVDISNFFLLICCPDDISDDLSAANQKYGYDSTVIGNLVVPVLGRPLRQDNFYPWETMCVFPLMHLDGDNSGKFYPCCKWPGSQPLGQVATHTLQQVFDSPAMQQLRQDLAQGIRHSNCQQCWTVEDSGGMSMRKINLEQWSKKIDLDWGDQDPVLRSVTIKPGNACNFKCRICTPHSSSLRGVEIMQHSQDPQEKIRAQQLIKANNHWFETNGLEFLSQLKDFPELINIDLYGGEPFVVKQIKTLLQDLVANDMAQNIRLHFNTNGSVYPNDLIELFENFREVDILLSIDNVGARFEVERGGVWEEVLTNLKKFASLQGQKMKFSFYVTVNIQNVLYLEDVYQLADQLGFAVILNYIEEFTPQWDIDNMTDHAKQLVIDKYKKHSNPDLKSIANRLQHSARSDGKKFIEHTDQLDRWRDQKFYNTHSEIYQAMKTQ